MYYQRILIPAYLKKLKKETNEQTKQNKTAL